MSSPNDAPTQKKADAGEDPDEKDFANYFVTYEFLYHQKEMLSDLNRMDAYFNAISGNPAQFKDKVVLDVGTGTGILAMWAAQAGAKKVYAVEATNMAKFARKLIKHNKLDHIVQVLQGTMETIELPEKVDIIVSEWMGYFLLRESMLDTVLIARDMYLKPGGALYPSHAQMFIAPIRTGQADQKRMGFQSSCEQWTQFVQETHHMYGVDMSGLTDDFNKEQGEYYLNTAVWADVHPSQVLGQACMIKDYDLHTVTLEEIGKDKTVAADFKCELSQGGPAGAMVQGIVGYFDTWFRGSEENPADKAVLLTTAPDADGATHWGQQVFYCHPPIGARDGDALVGDIAIDRNKENQRLMDVTFNMSLHRAGAPSPDAPVKTRYHIE